MKRKTIKNIFLILFIIIFVFSLIKIGLFILDMRINNLNNKKLYKEVVKTKINNDIEKTIEINFDKLIDINKDTIGWIIFNNEKINNPIVHTTDNSYYINHSFDGKYNQSGSIFMDYRNQSLDDKNVVLFAHSMLDGTMFGSIRDIFKDNYFDKEDNNYIKIINLNNETLIYQIFSYYIIEKEEYYITTSFNTNNDFEQFIDTIKKRSYKNFNIEVGSEDHILTLSTCSGTGNTTKRKVVHAKQIFYE